MLLMVMFFFVPLLSCDANGTTIYYTADENGLSEFEEKFSMKLETTTYASDGSWINYHFPFRY